MTGVSSVVYKFKSYGRYYFATLSTFNPVISQNVFVLSPFLISYLLRYPEPKSLV